MRYNEVCHNMSYKWSFFLKQKCYNCTRPSCIFIKGGEKKTADSCCTPPSLTFSWPMCLQCKPRGGTFWTKLHDLSLVFTLNSTNRMEAGSWLSFSDWCFCCVLLHHKEVRWWPDEVLYLHLLWAQKKIQRKPADPFNKYKLFCKDMYY